MLLAVDVGNTQTVFGLYDGDRARRALAHRDRGAADGRRARRAARRLPRLRRARRHLSLVDRAAADPRVRARRRALGEGAAARDRAGRQDGIPIQYDDPREIGPDRIMNAVAAKERYGAPAIVVDFGTSTNFDVVSAGGDYVGGVLAPGVEVSMDALFARAARLVKVDYVEPPTVIGKSTATALQSGLVYGFAGQVDGIVDAIRSELGADAPAIATGGLADLIAPHAQTISPGRSVPDARRPADRLGAEPRPAEASAAAVERDRHALEQELARPGTLGLELLEQRQPRRAPPRAAASRPPRSMQLHELVLERLREAAVAEVPGVELLQEARRAPLAELAHRLADEVDQLGGDLLARRLRRRRRRRSRGSPTGCPARRGRPSRRPRRSRRAPPRAFARDVTSPDAITGTSTSSTSSAVSEWSA